MPTIIANPKLPHHGPLTRRKFVAGSVAGFAMAQMSRPASAQTARVSLIDAAGKDVPGYVIRPSADGKQLEMAYKIATAIDDPQQNHDGQAITNAGPHRLVVTDGGATKIYAIPEKQAR